ncbi:MAG: peptidase S58 family protein [Dehalococcoidia bacterium]|nr:peptidase S58 family protein [Dehalococcoidia bacterium]
MNHAITDVPGIRLGHYTDLEHATGCTVVLCEGGAVGGVDVRGSSSGTRETEVLRPGATVAYVHGIVLSGGSAYGLDSAGGVMRYLEERSVGYRIRDFVVPIVPAAILFDLGLITHKVRPDAAAGYRACQAASDGPVEEGSVGAGTGATVAKILGPTRAVKGGLGTASVRLGEGVVVGAVVAVNAIGDIVDPETGRTVAGPRREDGRGFHDGRELLLSGKATLPTLARTSTTLVVVACNAKLTKEEATKLAQQGQNGVALAVRPAHTTGDGDVVFALATGQTDERLPLGQLGLAATTVVARAILRAVLAAKGLGGIPSVTEYAAAAGKQSAS